MNGTVTTKAKPGRKPGCTKAPGSGGSRKGIPNKLTADFRATVQKLLDDNADNVGRWLTLVAEGDGTDGGKPDPGKALDMLAKLAEYAAPKLARTEHTGEGGGAVRQSLTVSFVTP